MSDAADFVEGKEELQNDSFAQTVTFGERVSGLVEILLKAKQDCSADNWDGYGAKAISSTSYRRALDLALSLPFSVPAPEVYVDPDGHVTLEWYEDRRKVFSVSVGEHGDLSYAGLYGPNTTYGVEYLFAEIPVSILEGIRRVYSE